MGAGRRCVERAGRYARRTALQRFPPLNEPHPEPRACCLEQKAEQDERQRDHEQGSVEQPHSDKRENSKSSRKKRDRDDKQGDI